MAETIEKPLDAQINLRVPGGFSEQTRLAAALMGVTPSELMRRAILRQTAEVLSEKPAAASPKQTDRR